jgi:tRNA(adenine34) deaminase
MGMKSHEKYMQVALKQAHEALALGEFPVGTVFVHKGQIVASGKRAYTHEQTETVNEIDHAEILALRSFLAKETTIPADELTVYSTMEPCLMCYSTMILNGIRNMVYAYEDVMGGGTNLPLESLNPLYADMKVHIVPHVLRQESLELFQQFFSNPENLYWKDSLLANYTLSK